MRKLDEAEINNALSTVSNWFRVGNLIEKEFTKKNFSEALAFVIQVGIEAEKADHHPDINLHSWNKVHIKLSTHSAGSLTENDFKLAAIIDKL